MFKAIQQGFAVLCQYDIELNQHTPSSDQPQFSIIKQFHSLASEAIKMYAMYF